jgi:hypothetical protein
MATKTKQYKVIWPTYIYVELQRREPNEVFESETSHELDVLVFHKYLQEIELVGPDDTKPAKKKKKNETGDDGVKE